MAERRGAAVVGTAAALVAMPVLLDLAASGPLAAFRYLASDAFYYLTIARNAATGHGFSFDGVHPTNGFHPLWQLLLAALYRVRLALGTSESAYLALVVAIGAVLAAAAVLVLGRTILRERGAVPASFALAPVGLYAFLLAPAWTYVQAVKGNVSPAEGPFPLYGTAWSWANGMESGLALLGWAVLGAAFARSGGRATALLGLAGAFAVLARLDQAFVAGAVLAVAAVRSLRADGRRALPSVLAAGAAFGAPIAAYLLLNVSYAGVAFPVSGAAKFSFGAPGRAQLASFAVLARAGWSAPYVLDRAFRLAQLLVPAVAAAAFLAGWARRTRSGGDARPEGRDALDAFCSATAAGVLVLCGAVFLFTDPRSYGSWSLPVPVFFVSFAAWIAFARRPGPGSPLALAGAVAASVVLFLSLQRVPEYHARYRGLYERREAVVRAYGASPPSIVEVDDGIVSFATGFRALSAFGFAADRELVLALRDGRLAEVARARGFDRVASLVYLPEPARPETALRFLAASCPDRTGRAAYALEYWDASLPFAIARIVDRAAAPPGAPAAVPFR